ncbi:DUF4054 domain-containing protein [Methylobacterium sp. P1-11]|uniref:DUF4054 domain-containing protein n=1 Tax=Methylobacterium sp. P1-11 TaxID=2024616 RepID=UPI0011EC5C84|nr:DUF4054 domain-containing protein [Methylobacterium sp. P1-11]KAA0117876.1 DUF4054 domain-containing protein [Methylobacterium sp. P1-11]
MTITRADLLVAFPELATFPATQVDFWIGEAVNQLSSARFGMSYDLACMLYVAHQLSLSAAVTSAVASGGSATSVSLAPVTSKSVGPVSKSMDAGLTSFAGAGDWNATPYGVRFYGLLKRFAVGPVYRVAPKAVAGLYGFRRLF